MIVDAFNNSVLANDVHFPVRKCNGKKVIVIFSTVVICITLFSLISNPCSSSRAMMAICNKQSIHVVDNL